MTHLDRARQQVTIVRLASRERGTVIERELGLAFGELLGRLEGVNLAPVVEHGLFALWNVDRDRGCGGLARVLWEERAYGHKAGTASLLCSALLLNSSKRLSEHSSGSRGGVRAGREGLRYGHSATFGYRASTTVAAIQYEPGSAWTRTVNGSGRAAEEDPGSGHDAGYGSGSAAEPESEPEPEPESSAQRTAHAVPVRRACIH